MSNISEYRGKSPDELKDKALELKKELFNLRFQSAAGETTNTARYRLVRRDIARIKTLLNERGDVAVPVKKAKAAKPVKTVEAKAPKEPKAKKTTKKKASGE
jgi:large subunit ribosomal protein L29